MKWFENYTLAFRFDGALGDYDLCKYDTNFETCDETMDYIDYIL